MKKILVLFVFLILGCKTDSKKNVASDPVTLSLQVKNSTDQDFRFHQTWAVDKGDVTTIVKAGETITFKSNTHSPSGTVFTAYIMPPKSVAQPNPGNGNFQMTYGYWNGSAHVTCDNNCNKGYPTSTVHYTGNNWKYEAKFRDAESSINNLVEFTTSKM